jgi:hypothetical protein
LWYPKSFRQRCLNLAHTNINEHTGWARSIFYGER